MRDALKALQSDLFLAFSRGIENILSLIGDAVSAGGHKEARGIFEPDSVQLLRTIGLLEEGEDLGGNDLSGSVSFLREPL